MAVIGSSYVAQGAPGETVGFSTTFSSGFDIGVLAIGQGNAIVGQSTGAGPAVYGVALTGDNQGGAGVAGQGGDNAGLNGHGGAGVRGDAGNAGDVTGYGGVGVIGVGGFGPVAGGEGVFGAGGGSSQNGGAGVVAVGAGVDSSEPGGVGVDAFGGRSSAGVRAGGGQDNGPGVLAFGGGSGGDGVFGVGNGVLGAGVRALNTTMNGKGMVAVADEGPEAFGVWGRSRQGFAGVFDGRVLVRGDLDVTGAKSAVVAFRDGSRRRLYCVESPESWLEDFGSARLVRGHAEVRLARDFASVVRAKDYHVFLTEYGDNNALYVTKRTSKSFVVQAKSSKTAKSSFSYRVVAKRKDISGARFEKVPIPNKALRSPMPAPPERPKPHKRPAAPTLPARPIGPPGRLPGDQ